MDQQSNISQELLETVERYLNKEMTAQEAQAFSKKLTTNADLAAQVADIQTLLTAVETQTLKDKMEQFHSGIDSQEVANKEVPVRRLNILKLAVAAAVALAVISVWFLNEDPNKALYANHYSPDPGLATTMSAQSNFDFYDGMVSYKTGNYEAALDKWQELNKTQANSDTLNYFIGQALMANTEAEKAIPYLVKTTQENESAFKEEAYFYLGLAYLKNEQLALAKEALTKSQLGKSKLVLNQLNP